MNRLSVLIPKISTLVLWFTTALVWMPIYADLVDRLGEPYEELYIWVVALGSFGVAGLYGGLSVARAERSDRFFLALVFVRTVLLIGLAVGVPATVAAALGLD